MTTPTPSPRRERKKFMDTVGGLNRWGYFICGPCRSGYHRGTMHVGLCSCSCDGRHDAKGRLLV